MVTQVATRAILIVDDDFDCRFTMAKLLGLVGYEVMTAGSGEEALELVEEREFALVIIDYMMPRMHGLELFERIRELRPNIRGIFVTGYLTPESTGAALERGLSGWWRSRWIKQLCGLIDELAVSCCES